MSEAGPGRQIPDFAVTLRGYDRGQVEEYVSALQTFLAEAQRRAAAAEAALAELPDGGSPAAQTDETSRPDQTNRADEGAFRGDAAAHVDLSDPLLGGCPTGSAPALPASSPRRSRLPASLLTNPRRSRPDRWPQPRAATTAERAGRPGTGPP